MIIKLNHVIWSKFVSSVVVDSVFPFKGQLQNVGHEDNYLDEHGQKQGERIFLIEAVQDNESHVLNWLLKKEATVDVVDTHGATSIMRAAENTDGLPMVKALLEAGADVDLTDNEGKTAMHYAAAGGSLDTVILLQSQMTDPMKVDEAGQNPIHKAAAHGHEAILAHLLSSVKDVESMFDKKGLTPVHLAAAFGQMEVLDYFQNESVNLNVRSFPGKDTPLISATMNRQIDIVKYLVVENEVEIDSVNAVLRSALHFATKDANIDLVEFLISSNCSIDSVDSYGKTPLFFAFETGSYELSELLMSVGASTNISDNQGNKLIHAAAQSGSIPLLKYLIREKVSVKTTNNVEATPLIIASENGHLEVVKFLIKHGALIEKGDQRGYTCMHAAAQSGHKDMVEFLISKGASLRDKTNLGMTPLHYASLNGRVHVVQLLAKYMVNTMSKAIGKGSRDILHSQINPGCMECYKILLNVNDNYQRTPLFFAAENGQYETLNVLIELGADYGLKNVNGTTPFMVAALKGHVNVLSFLALRNVNFMETDNQMKTALHYSAEGGSLSTLQFLIDNDANVYVKAHNEKTVMHIAAELGNLSLVKELGVFHDLISSRDSMGRTPIWFACYNGHIRVIKHLIHLGAKIDQSIVLAAVGGGDLNVVKYIIWNGGDIKARNRSGHTLVDIAYELGKPQLISFLLDSGVSLQEDGTFHYKNTLLHLSSSRGQIQITKILLTHGADIEMKDELGNTPLHLATGNYQVETVALLLDYGAIPNITNNLGESPVFRAIRSNKTDVVKCFFEHGKYIDALKGNLKAMLEEAIVVDAIESLKYLINIDKGNLINDLPIHKVQSVETFREMIKAGFDVNMTDNRSRGRLEEALDDGARYSVVECLFKFGAQIVPNSISQITNIIGIVNRYGTDPKLRDLVISVVQGNATRDQLKC